MAGRPIEEQRALAERLGRDGCVELLHTWRGFNARPDQLAPDGDWFTWLVLAGRGFGKTRTGAEWIKEEVANGARSVALVAETYADARQVMVEGGSGLLACYADNDPDKPEYLPSQKKLIWPNGAVGLHFDAREPDQLRGPQFDRAWCDELAKWRYSRETWDQLMFGLRLGEHPKVVVTTTPRPIELIREQMARANRGDGVVVTRGRTLDNADNLAPTFIAEIQQRYAGTRLGRQELDAEILEDTPGALWTRANLDEHRKSEAPPLQRVVVAVDPPAKSHEDADECGIVVCGMGEDGRGYCLGDYSFAQATPNAWARRAWAAYDEFDADAIVAEANQGGEMVEAVLHGVRANVPVTLVHASRGKHIRAEPIAALYEQGRISHVGAFAGLEDQMVMMTNSGFEGGGSPDRLDALVWGFTELFPGMTQRASASHRAPRVINAWSA